MLCQKCGKRTASVHYKQIINGTVSEKHLCSECAAVNDIHSPFEKVTEEFFGNLFSGSPSVFGRSRRSCPLCGATARDISIGGKVGCAKCYEVFSDELRSTIVGIHGNVHHVGRAPGKHKEAMEFKARLEAMKAEQQKAIEEQDFELAAELRDKIKALTEKSGKEGE